MVIFGAGASHDSAPDYPSGTEWPARIEDYRLPLADELFANRPDFITWIDRLEDNTRANLSTVVFHLRQPSGGSVEQELERLRKEAETSARAPERRQQLAVVQFYLQSMLWECQDKWKALVTHGVTNYKDLLEQIDMWRRESNEKVCLVTFNYDTMLEDALSALAVGINVQTIDDYIAHDYKIIKLHGSANWAHRVNIDMDPIVLADAPLTMAKELIKRAALLKENKLILPDYDIINRPLAAVQGSVFAYPSFPALAIPVENKQNYECPKKHLEELYACIPQVTNILMIGWRATEADFLKLLKDKLGKQVHVMAVNGQQISAQQANSKLLQAGIDARCDSAETGFSDFVVRREADAFLRSM